MQEMQGIYYKKIQIGGNWMKKWVITTALLCSLASPVMAEGTAQTSADAPAEKATGLDISTGNVQLSLIGVMVVGLGAMVLIGKKGS
jgi:hypothetical protein